MTTALMISMLAFVGYSAIRATKQSRKVTTVSDFFSFGPELDSSALRRAFQATNISFTTAFITLYLFVFSQGYFAFFTPFFFCLGIVIYAFIFLPRQIRVLSEGYRYPELLAKATNTPSLQKWISLFVILSLWMFMYTEVQGLNLFLGKLFSDVTILSQIVPMILIVALAFYVSRNGYRATTSNDKFQVRIIFIGALAVIILSIISAKNIGFKKVLDKALNLPNPFGSFKDTVLFIFETFMAFAFSQVLYYDNWQRLSFYASKRLKQENNGMANISKESIELVTKEIRWEYIRGSAVMLIVFSAPILLGLINIASGTNSGDIATLADFVKHSWTDTPIFGPILVIFAFMFMLSALLSTGESYLIAIVNCVVEDIFKRPVRSGDNSKQISEPLEGVRILTALAAVSLVPFLLIRPSFDKLFLYLFYSANGFVGPLVILSFQRQLRAWAVKISIALGFIYPLSLYFEQLSDKLPYPGIVPVVASLVLVGVTSTKNSRG